MEARQAQRDQRRAGARGPRATVIADDGDRRSFSRSRGRQGTRLRRGRRAGRDGGREVPAPLARRGRPSPREGDRHLLDLHRRAWAERIDVHRPRDRVDRSGLRRLALLRRRCALGAVARRRARIRQADARRGSGNGRSRAVDPGDARRREEDHGLRAPDLPRRGSPLANPEADGEGARLAAGRGRRGARGRGSKALQERHPERVLATNVEYYSAIVLDVAEIPPRLAPAMFACSRVAGWSAHILEQKRTGRLFRPSARYVGPASRSLQSVS